MSKQWRCCLAGAFVTAIAKGKDRRRKRVKLHRLLDQDRKAVDARPEVDRFAMQVDLEISVQFEHDSTLP